ncbi:hypothetical protein [Egibacter rhizosphaerae]|uniref:hypothetical protein n=1 Tax=Egibacter rhizosphaerae TaxID=1670831 RepID=UPI00197AA838|nr:hypothetical protein [Egibacter rhizosphaerae]
MMIMIGIDAHSRTDTVVAVDELGREIDQITVAATGEGHLKLLRWRGRFTLVLGSRSRG